MNTQETPIKRVSSYMAILRNLRNLVEKGVDLPHLQLVARALQHPAAVRGSKQLPFRFYSAYKALAEQGSAPGFLLDAVEGALRVSLDNLPAFPGRLMALSDNSGSAHGAFTSSLGSVNVADIGNLTSLLAALRADDGYVGLFGDRLDVVSARKTSSILDQAKSLNQRGCSVGGGTENGVWLFWDRALTKSEKWDNVFIFSDMQAGHGGLYGVDERQYRDFAWPNNGRYIDVPKLIKAYREKVNPDVNVFLVQTAGYQDTLVPENYHRTAILGGWSDQVLNFAAQMTQIWDGETAK